MSKLVRAVLAIVIIGSGLAVADAATAVSGSPVTAVTCEGTEPVGAPGHIGGPGGPELPANPGVAVPTAVPVVGGTTLIGKENPCADLYRTLVFEGTAVISDGLNFAGTGPGFGTVTGSYVFGGPGQPGLNSTVGLPGICVMVDWQNNDVAAVSPAPTIVNCTFFAQGSYTAPTRPDPLINALFGPMLGWAPANQPSCFNSNGSGIINFTAKETVSGRTEVWGSAYTWENTLDHLRGNLSGTRSGSPIGGGPFTFDAKIEAHADPVAAIQDLGSTTRTNPFDASDAGCIEKNGVLLSGGLTQTTDNQGIGLNHILVAGTATWKMRAPKAL